MRLDVVLFCLMSFLMCVFAFIAVLLTKEVLILRKQLIEAECKFEAIDPIRAEAGAPMSDKCKCFWKEVSLEQLRKMKP